MSQNGTRPERGTAIEKHYAPLARRRRRQKGGDARSAWAKAPADAGPLSTRASCEHRGRGVRTMGHGGGGRGRARISDRFVRNTLRDPHMNTLEMVWRVA